MAFISAGKITAYLELDTSKFTSGFQAAKQDFNSFANESQNASGKLDALSGGFTKTGTTLTKGVTAPLLGIAGASLKVTSDFDTAMSQVAATMGMTAEEVRNGNKDFEKLSDTASEMGRTTKFTATEAAEGLNILAMSGLNANESISVIPHVLDLASAGAMSLDSAATYVTASVKGFGDSMDNAQYYADLMAKGATLANTDVNMLGVALSDSAATARSYGQSAESTTLSLLKLAEQNVTGSEAATALNRAMTDLYVPTDKAREALEELGIQTYNADGTARDFNDIVDDLQAALSGMSDEEAIAYKNMIFTTYGLQAFNKMTSTSTEKAEQFKDGLNNAFGSAGEQARTQIDNLAGDVTLLTSALEGAGQQIGERLRPYIRDFTQFINDLVTAFNNLSDEQLDQIVKWGTIIALVGPALILVGKILSGVKNFIDIITGVGSLVSKILGFLPKVWEFLQLIGGFVMAHPIALAIAGVVAAIIYLWNNCDEFREFILNLWDTIKEKISSFGEWLGVFFTETIPEFFSNLWETLKTFFTETIPEFFAGVWETIQKFFTDVGEGLKTFFTETVPEFFIGFLEKIKEILGNIWDAITETFTKVVDTIKEKFNDVAEFFNNIWDKIKDIFKKGVENILLFFTKTIPDTLKTFVFETVPNFVKNVINFFAEIPYKIGYFIGEILGKIYSWGADMINWAREKIPEFVNTVITFISELPGKIWDWLSDTTVKVFNWGVDLIAKAGKIGLDFVNGIIDFAKELPGKMWDIITDIGKKVYDWGIDIVKKAADIGKDFVGNVVDFVKELPGKVWDIIREIPGKVADLGSFLFDAGLRAFHFLWDGIASVGQSIIDWVGGFVDIIYGFINGIIDGFNNIIHGADNARNATMSVNGSHAEGLSYVPFNGYTARLHEGERVLTKQQNRDYNKNRNNDQGGDTFNFYGNINDPYENARRIKQAKRELLYNF